MAVTKLFSGNYTKLFFFQKHWLCVKLYRQLGQVESLKIPIQVIGIILACSPSFVIVIRNSPINATLQLVVNLETIFLE